MKIKLLTEHHLEFLSLKGDCTGSSESTLVKTPQCWKSHVAAQIQLKQTSPIFFRKETKIVAQNQYKAQPPPPSPHTWELQQTMDQQQHNHHPRLCFFFVQISKNR